MKAGLSEEWWLCGCRTLVGTSKCTGMREKRDESKCPALAVLFPFPPEGHAGLFVCGKKINTNRGKNVSDVGEVTVLEISRESCIG